MGHKLMLPLVAVEFQVREPVSPLLTGLLQNTNVMMEIQAAQEYTGQAVHAVGLTRQWAHYLGDLDQIYTLYCCS
jgi:alpha-glucuronidase